MDVYCPASTLPLFNEQVIWLAAGLNIDLMSSHYEVFMVVILAGRMDRSQWQVEDLTKVAFTYLPY